MDPLRTIREPGEIGRLTEIINRSPEVRSYTGVLRSHFTHWIYLPYVWCYDSVTGHIGFMSTDVQPVYQIPPELKTEFDRLLEKEPSFEGQNQR